MDFCTVLDWRAGRGSWEDFRFRLVSIKILQLKMRYRRLNNLVFLIKRNPKVYWRQIFRFLSRNKKLVTNHRWPIDHRSFLRDYPKIFLGKLLKYGCSQFNLTKRILKLYGLYCGWYVADNREFIKHFREKKTAVNKQICSPLDSAEINDSMHLSDIEMIELAVQAKDVKFLTALLKYGVCNTPQEILVCEYPTAMHVIVQFWVYCLKQQGSKPTTINILDDALKNGGDIGNGNRRGARRILLIVRIIEILGMKYLKKGTQSDLENYVLCIRLYFRSTVEPFIFKDDIVELLCAHFTDISNDFLEHIAQDFESLFKEESATAYAPRNLKHLCRHSFRRYVVENGVGVLPEVVERIKLPKSLASYVLCES